MKLNLDFSLYKGKTRLKHWWPKVKEHFTRVQTAHNALEDTAAAEKTRLDTEIDQRTNADIALSDRINAEKSARESADMVLDRRIDDEAATREEADSGLDNKIDEEVSKIKSELYGEGKRTCDDLLTENKDSFLDATNELVADIATVENNCNEQIREIRVNEMPEIEKKIDTLKERLRVDFGDVIYDKRVDLDWAYPVNEWDISKYGYLQIGDQIKFTLKEIVLEDGSILEETSHLAIYIPYSSHYLNIHNNGESFQVGHTYTAVVTEELYHGNQITNDAEAIVIIDNGSSKSLVDASLSATSENPVQNKVVKMAVDTLENKKIIQGGSGCSVNGKSVIIACDKASITGSSNIIAASGASYDTNDVINGINCAVIGSGEFSITNGGFSVVLGGYNNIVDGTRAATLGGYNLKANQYNVVCGKNNKELQASDYNTKSGDLLAVGNGTTDDKSNAFRVAADGNCYAGVAFNGTGADYNEAREWSDGNADNEDRCGYMVAFEGTKIRLAQPDDNLRKVGIITGNSCITGNNFADFWHGKYKRDIYGRYETKPVHNEAEYDEDGKLIKEEFNGFTYIVSDDYDMELEDAYIPRLERSEYDLMATHGEVVVRDDGTCEADGYCIPGTDGIATRDNEEIGFYVMERVDANHIRVFVR